MNSLRWTAACLAIAAVFSVLLGTRAGAQEPAAFERVEYLRAEDGRGPVASLVLVSSKDAEVVLEGKAETLRGRWSLVRGRNVRFVGPGRTVRWFSLKAEGLVVAGERMSIASGRSAHEKLFADPRGEGEPEGFEGAAKEAFFLHDDRSADWRLPSGELVDVERELTDETTLLLTMPDGARRAFVRDGPDWRDRDTGARFESRRVRGDRTACLQNLSQLATVFVAESIEKPGKPRYSGPPLLLSWRKNKRIIQLGQEEVLRCPGDPGLQPLDEALRKSYDDVDLADPPDDLCSYAVREFTNWPLPGERTEQEILFCCRQGRDGRTPHHPGGICVAFDDGSARFMTKEDLGIAPEDAIVVGPASTHRMLRKVALVAPKRK